MGPNPQKILDLITFTEEIFSVIFRAVKNQLSCISSFDLFITVALIKPIIWNFILAAKKPASIN